MNVLEGSYQSELDDFVSYWKFLNGRVNWIYKENPPVFLRRALRFKDWPSFEGEDMSPEWVSLYDYPAEDKILAFLNREYNKVGKDLFGNCHCQEHNGADKEVDHWPWNSKKKLRK